MPGLWAKQQAEYANALRPLFRRGAEGSTRHEPEALLMKPMTKAQRRRIAEQLVKKMQKDMF